MGSKYGHDRWSYEGGCIMIKHRITKITYAYGIFFIIIIIALLYPFFNIDKRVAFERVKEVVSSYVDQQNMQLQTDKTISKNYLVKKDEYQDMVSFGPISYMNVDEITLFYQPDPSLRASLYKKMQEHVTSQIRIFEGYGEVQTKMLKDAYVAEKGDYVICIITPNSDQAAEAFHALF